MKESSKQVLEDKIKFYRLGELFEITETEIRCPRHESLAVFKGLQGSSAFSLKSLEGFTDAWVEEAHSISQRSLDTMTPTFRRTPGMASEPEMIFTWNAVHRRDPIERLFRFGGCPHPSDKDAGDVGPPDADFVCVSVTYRDNPWFPDDLRRDMLRDRARDPDKYAHVWLGEYERRAEAAVYRNWTVEEFDSPPLQTAIGGERFYYGADWGFARDPTALIRCFIRGRVIYIDHEAHRVGCEIDDTPALFDAVPGSRRWPIRADSARPETISYMRRRGFNISAANKGAGSVEDGIEFVNSYDIIVHPRCQHTIDELAKYSWKVDPKTNEVLPILVDKNNHVMDALRYCLEGERLAGRSIILSNKQLQQVAHLPPRNRFGSGRSQGRFVRAR
jgi:phage terminase large subunit